MHYSCVYAGKKYVYFELHGPLVSLVANSDCNCIQVVISTYHDAIAYCHP